MSISKKNNQKYLKSKVYRKIQSLIKLKIAQKTKKRRRKKLLNNKICSILFLIRL